MTVQLRKPRKLHLTADHTQKGAPYPTTSALKKARYRMRNFFLKAGKKLSSLRRVGLMGPKTIQETATPESKKIKKNLNKQLEILQQRHDKRSLAKWRLLLEIKGGQLEPQQSIPYKRTKQNPSTLAAVQFMEDQSVFLPCKRSVLKKTGGQKKVLPKRMKRLHQEFLAANSGQKLSLRTVYRHRPKHVKTYKHQALRMCLCEVCVNVDLKLDAINQHLNVPVEGRDELSELSVCPNPTLSCLHRTCKECGILPVERKIIESCKSEMAVPVKWHMWQMVKEEKGQRREKILQVGTLGCLLVDLMKELAPLSRHIFTHRWQHKELKRLLSKLKSLPGTAVIINDFAENYLCKYQDEVQSAHWGYNQVTIHPNVLYYPCYCGDLITKYLVFLSDDLQHDAHMVRDITGTIKDYLTRKRFHNLIMWSDGCSAQYKSKLPFFFTAESGLEWVYFGSRHGKSPCDACGGVVKVACDEDVKHGSRVQMTCSSTCPNTTVYQKNNPCLQIAATRCARFD